MQPRGQYSLDDVTALALEKLLLQVNASPVPASPAYGWLEEGPNSKRSTGMNGKTEEEKKRYSVTWLTDCTFMTQKESRAMNKKKKKQGDELTTEQLATLKNLWDEHSEDGWMSQKHMWRLITDKAHAASAEPFYGIKHHLCVRWLAAQPAPVDDHESQGAEPAVKRARIKMPKFDGHTEQDGATMQLSAEPDGIAAPNTRAPLPGGGSFRTKRPTHVRF